MMSKPKFAGRAKHLAAAGMLLLLAACGGGTQVEKFVPKRVLAFGDETSVFDESGGYTANGRKYTANGYTIGTTTLDCRVNPIWIQYVANVWGLVFSQCNPTAVAATSQSYAVAGARVGDIAGQIDAASDLGEKDLATVLVGANDLIALYEASPDAGSANLAAAQSLAIQLAAQIARIVKTGAKVAFVTVPNLGQTPYALADVAVHPERAGVLSALTSKFNAQLRTAISNANSPSFIDGHQGVQVLADELFDAVITTATTSPNAATYLNVTTPFCTTTLAIDCTPVTVLTDTTTPALILGGSAFNYLWADAKHLGPGGHGTLGSAAASRIVANPL